MCQFQQLYYDDLGYVVRCQDCHQYQVCYASMILTLSATDFELLCAVVRWKCESDEPGGPDSAKTIVIPTPSRKIFYLLNRREAFLFHSMLETADTEAKAQLMLSLFCPASDID